MLRCIVREFYFLRIPIIRTVNWWYIYNCRLLLHIHRVGSLIVRGVCGDGKETESITTAVKSNGDHFAHVNPVKRTWVL